jgi:putative membrane protein insertion efficiency factor
MNAMRPTVERPAGPRFRSFCAALPGRFLLLLIQLYQRTVSPLLPVVSLGTCGCRFTPTCSHYAAEAIRTHGAFAGTGLALSRLVRCTPRHPGGFDPVPLSRPRRRPALPVCSATKPG